MEQLTDFFANRDISGITKFLYETNFENCREFVYVTDVYRDIDPDFVHQLAKPIRDDVVIPLLEEGDIDKLKFMLEYDISCGMIARICCQKGYLEILKYIVANCPNEFLFLVDDDTINDLLEEAIGNKHVDIFEYLLEIPDHVDVEIFDRYTIDYKNTLTSACIDGDLDFVEKILQKCNIDINHEYLLGNACFAGKIEIVEFFLKTPGLNVHANYDYAFNNAIRGLYIDSDYHEIPRENLIKIITLLLERHDGFTIDKLPYIFLEDTNHIELARDFHNNQLNFDQATIPLHDINSHDDVEVLELLLKYSDKITFPLDNLQHELEIAKSANNQEMILLWEKIVNRQSDN